MLQHIFQKETNHKQLMRVFVCACLKGVLGTSAKDAVTTDKDRFSPHDIAGPGFRKLGSSIHSNTPRLSSTTPKRSHQYDIARTISLKELY